jgi:hypothetical protein
MDGEIDWLRVLIQGYNLPEELIHTYLNLYLKAINQHLPGQASSIVTWLDSQIGLLGQKSPSANAR